MSVWSVVFPSAVALGLAAAACSSSDDEAPLVAVKDAPDAAPLSQTEPPPVVDAAVVDARPATCLEKLTALGITYETTVARGVEDAVIVTSPIGGIPFTSGETDEPASFPMACTFVLTLDRFASVLKSKGVVRVGTLGSYCYRCCCAWSPTNECRSPTDPEPNCGDNGYSNHSWGRAIDVRWLHLQSGVVYDVNDPAQWVAGSSATTCTSGLSKQKGVSQILYGIACDVAAQGIFDTILTPNYNDAHRNHWHMDIGKPDNQPPWTTTVRSLASKPTPIDVGGSDTCGGG